MTRGIHHASGGRELSALAKLQPQFVMQMTETVRSKGAEPRKENAMTAIEVQLIERLKKLHPSRVAESPRVLRRLQSLRGWSHEKVKQVLTRGP